MKFSYSTATKLQGKLTHAGSPKANITQVDGMQWVGRVVGKLHPPECGLHAGVDCDCQGEEFASQNTVLLTGINSILDHMVGLGLDTSKGFVTYFEVGLSAIAANSGQTGTVLPLARKELRGATRSGTNAIYKTFFNGEEANCAQATVAIGTSTTQFTLLGGQGSLFTIGESVRVTIGGTPYDTTITNIATDTLTVSPALGAIPSGGEPVAQLITEVTLYGDASANATTGTGVGYARTASFTPRVKLQGFGLTLEWHVSLN